MSTGDWRSEQSAKERPRLAPTAGNIASLLGHRSVPITGGRLTGGSCATRLPQKDLPPRIERPGFGEFSDCLTVGL